MTVAVAAPAPEDDREDDREELVLEHVLCICGALAAIVIDADEESAWCSIRCACGAFRPAVAEDESR